jgi:hypothetical protein
MTPEQIEKARELYKRQLHLKELVCKGTEILNESMIGKTVEELYAMAIAKAEEEIESINQQLLEL